VIPFRRAALSFGRRLPRLLTPRFTITILITRLTVFRHKVLPKRVPCIVHRGRPTRQVPRGQNTQVTD
jgi:hypothetical protein